MQKNFKIAASYGRMTLGLFLSGLGWTAFMIPSHITGGGISGVATLIYFATNIPVGASNLVMSTLLLGIAFKSLGAGFGIRTIYNMIMNGAILWILQSVISEPFVQERFMAAVIGGILMGAGTGLVYIEGASMGGTSIIVNIITKHHNISPGKIFLFLDVLVISCSYIIFQSVEVIVYGLASMAICSYTVDMIISGDKQSVQLYIFSKKHEEIAMTISETIHRGITSWDAQGWHSKEEVTVLMIMVRRSESVQILKIVKEIDPDAYISQGSVMGIYGPGFETIKS